MANENGVLVVSVLEAPYDDALLVKGEKYYVSVRFNQPLLLSDRKSFRTRKSQPNQFKALKFDYNQEIALEGKINRESRIVLTLFQANLVFADPQVAVGTCELWPLWKSSAIERTIDFVLAPPPENAPPPTMEDNMPPGQAPPATASPVKGEAKKPEVSSPAPPTLAVASSPPKTVMSVTCRLSWKDGNIPDLLDVQESEDVNAKLKGTGGLNRDRGSVPLPAPEGNDYNIYVRLHRARNLQNRSNEKLYDPLAQVTIDGGQCGDGVIKGSKATDWIKGTNNPIWDEELVFNFGKVGPDFWSTTITITVADHWYGIPNTPIGSFQIDCGTVYRDNDKHLLSNKWLVIHREVTTGDVMGFLKASIGVINARTDAIPDDEPEDPDGDSDESIISNLIVAPGARFEEMHLGVHLLRAEQLPVMDGIGVGKVISRLTQGFVSSSSVEDGLCDPYCRVIFGTKQVETHYIRQTLDPVWNTVVDLTALLPALTRDVLVQVWDKDWLTPDDLVATLRFDFESLIPMLNANKGVVFGSFDSFFNASMDPSTQLAAAARPGNYVPVAAQYKYATSAFANSSTNINVGTPQLVFSDELEEGKAAARRIKRESLRGTEIYGSVIDRDTTHDDDILGPQLPIDPRLPYYAPRWVCLYGNPRNRDADYNAFYKKMCYGQIQGCDYRGRVLLGIEGSRTQIASASRMEVAEATLYITCLVQVLLVSMVPQGRYAVRVTFGTNVVVTTMKDAVFMKGSSLCSLSVNEEVRVRGKFNVVIPTSPYSAKVADQLPDIIVSLIPISSLNIVSGAGAKQSLHSDPFAYARFKASDLLGHSKASYSSEVMRVNYDPAKLSEGEQPTDPVAQLYTAMFVNLTDPALPLLVPTAQNVVMPGITDENPQTFLLEACIFHARNLPAGDSNGLSDPYVRVCWANGVSQTGYQSETLNPIWNETLRIVADIKERMRFPDIIVELWDWDRVGRDTFLGKRVISFEDAEAAELVGQTRWYRDWRDNKGRIIEGCAVLMSFEALRGTKKVLDARPKAIQVPRKYGSPSASRGDSYPAFAIPSDKALPTQHYKIQVHVFALRHMRPFRLFDIICPGIEVELVGRIVRLREIYGSNPTFNKKFTLCMELPKDPDYLPSLNFRVYDYRIGTKQLVGSTAVELRGEGSDYRALIRESKRLDQAVKDRINRIRIGFGANEDPSVEMRAAPSLKRTAQAIRALAGKHLIGDLAVDAVPSERSDQRVLAQALPTTIAPPAAATTGVQTPGSGRTSLADPYGDGVAASAGDATDPLLAAARGPNAQPQPATSTVPQPQPAESGYQSVNASAPSSAAKAKGGGVPLPPPPATGAKGYLQRAAASAVRRIKGLDAQTDTTDSDDEELQLQDSEDDDDEFRSWFDFFDPEAANVGKGRTDPMRRVVRMGQLDTKALGLTPLQTTVEDVFGPFDDFKWLMLSRGWGAERVEAGDVGLEVLVTPISNREADSLLSQPSTVSGDGGPEVADQYAWLPIRFVCRVYVLMCYHLAAMDSGLMGDKSDPYPIFTLTSRSGGKNDKKTDVVCNCKDAVKYQTLNPEFFLVRELEGHFPKHNTLRVTFMDYDKIGKDDLIGFTDIDLESRWYSKRGMNGPNSKQYFTPGTYTEKRHIYNEMGQATGTVEMWIDLFQRPEDETIVLLPRPIYITPPKPVTVEVRAIVWNTRDVELVDVSNAQEVMTDIYVRGWLNGMRHDIQNTDVHYRSLDGTGNFNWRFIFNCCFDPRTRRLMEVQPESFFSRLFSTRNEAKKFSAEMLVQIWDNDLLPGTDDYIGETVINLLDMRPATVRRYDQDIAPLESLCCCEFWPFNRMCMRRKTPAEMSLREKQLLAAQEAERDETRRKARFFELANDRLAPYILSGQFTERYIRKLRRKFMRDIEREERINVFDRFLPNPTNKNFRREATLANGASSGAYVAAQASSTPSLSTALALGANAIINGGRAGKSAPSSSSAVMVEEGAMPLTLEQIQAQRMVETPKYWFPCRAPDGGYRIGDVQISFQVAVVDDIQKNEQLAAGKGRSAPNALPEPKRPDNSFFWLTSPLKSAYYILWKNYKWYIITIFCFILSAIYVWLFFAGGVNEISHRAFGSGAQPPGVVVINGGSNSTTTMPNLVPITTTTTAHAAPSTTTNGSGHP